jgi:hypothetical protein
VTIDGRVWTVRYDVSFQFHNEAAPAGLVRLMEQLNRPGEQERIQNTPWGLLDMATAPHRQSSRLGISGVEGFRAGDNAIIQQVLPGAAGSTARVFAEAQPGGMIRLEAHNTIAIDPWDNFMDSELYRTMIHEVGHSLGFDERYNRNDQSDDPAHASHLGYENDFMNKNPASTGFSANHREASARFALFAANGRNVSNAAIRGLQVENTGSGRVSEYVPGAPSRPGSPPSPPIRSADYEGAQQALQSSMWSDARRQLAPAPPPPLVPRIQLFAPPNNQIAPVQILPQFPQNPGPGIRVFQLTF